MAQRNRARRKAETACVVCAKPVARRVQVRTNGKRQFVRRRTCSAACATEAVRRSKRGDANPAKRPAVAAKIAETLRSRHGAAISASLRERWRAGRMPVPVCTGRPSKLEARFGELLRERGLPILATGSGTFWIGPCASGTRRCPDFIHSSRRLRRAVLFSGRRWHPPDEMAAQIADYVSIGWSVLNVWAEALRYQHLDQAVSLAREFLETGSVSGPLPEWAALGSTR